MKVRPAALLAGVLVLAIAGGAAADEAWDVTAAERTGALRLGAPTDGRVEGVLLGGPVEGFLVGRSLVLLRRSGRELELWQGTLDPAGSVLTGTIATAGPPVPFFAVRRPGGAAAAASGEPAPAPAPGLQELGPPVTVATEPTAAAPEAGAGAEGGVLSGTWSTPAGPVEVADDGRRIAVRLPDGREAEGRWVAPDAFIVGLYRGCCRGELSESGAVSWSDGSTWRRP